MASSLATHWEVLSRNESKCQSTDSHEAMATALDQLAQEYERELIHYTFTWIPMRISNILMIVFSLYTTEIAMDQRTETKGESVSFLWNPNLKPTQ